VDVKVVKPVGLGLDENTADTVRTWKFHPAIREGVPVNVRYFTCIFPIDNPSTYVYTRTSLSTSSALWVRESQSCLVFEGAIVR